MHKFISILVLFLFFTIANAYDLQYHPFLLQTKDASGRTLAKIVDGIYAEKITVKDERCYYFEKQNNKGDLEYEIDKCKLNYHEQKVYTQADRLNGIAIKGQIWIEGNSYRTRQTNKSWSEWQSTELASSINWGHRTGISFQLKNGEFEFTPTNGFKNIRGDYNYISKNKAKAIENGDAAGIVVQESGSGEIIIQESR